MRADIQARFASDEQAVKMRARALEDTDRIVGRLLEHVDERDMVVVVGPTPPQDRAALSVAAVRGTGLRTGAAAFDHDAARRLRQPRRRRADRPHLLRARPARRDGGSPHGDRRGGRLVRRPSRSSSSTSTRTACSATDLVGPVDERALRAGASLLGGRGHRARPLGRDCGARGPSACSCSARCGCSASSTPPTSPARSTSVATAAPSRTGRSSSAWAR